MIRPSARATIVAYLEKAIDRLELDDADQGDLTKAVEHLEKANEEIEKELEE